MRHQVFVVWQHQLRKTYGHFSIRQWAARAALGSFGPDFSDEAHELKMALERA
jgi:hypothetical protein